jgi:hypothetical protein
MCMVHEAVPGNGGLCGYCCPPLQRRRHWMRLSVRHVPL